MKPKEKQGGAKATAAKPKHGLDAKRANKEDRNMRSASTVRRLKMYNSGRAVRDKKGKVLYQELQSKELPSTRIQPDRRWFGNTRVVGQSQLASFRQQMAGNADNPFMVLLRQRKLPMQLLEDPEAKGDRKRQRKEVLQRFSFAETFGAKSGQRQKRPRLAVEDLDSMREKVQGQQEVFESRHTDVAPALGLPGDEREFSQVRQRVLDKGQSKRIWGELHKVIDSSDVVVQVLDARDPEGTRCGYLEKHLRRNHRHKHLILLLNKVDLVPPWNARRWLHHLSREFPVLAFHASVTKPFGKGALLSLLRQLARLRSDKKAISVGFVGYPNVGKSSVINTLRTKKVCTVAPVPGETKVWQFVTLMKRVFLIDCPGVVYHETNDSDAATVLKGVVRIEKLEDAALFVPEVLERVKKQYLLRAYNLKGWSSPQDFLEQLARNSGRLTKGGEPDVNTVAKMVLLDWQKGKLPFFSNPPGYTAEAGPEGEQENTAVATADAEDLLASVPQHAVTAADAQAEADADPELAAAAAVQLAEDAVRAAADQSRAALPRRPLFFDAEDLGKDAEQDWTEESDGEAEALSDGSVGTSSPGSPAHHIGSGARTVDADGGSLCADYEDLLDCDDLLCSDATPQRRESGAADAGAADTDDDADDPSNQKGRAHGCGSGCAADADYPGQPVAAMRHAQPHGAHDVHRASASTCEPTDSDDSLGSSEGEGGFAGVVVSRAGKKLGPNAHGATWGGDSSAAHGDEGGCSGGSCPHVGSSAQSSHRVERQAGARQRAVVDGDGEDEDDDEGGYGPGGLSWRAVMKHVLGKDPIRSQKP